MYAPVFEIKDSYIVKHKLNYNTSYDFGYYDENKNFISYKQKMLFVDYSLARKSLNENAENFEPIVIGTEINNYDLIAFTYLDENYVLKLDGDLSYENKWINTTTVKQISETGTTYQLFTITGNTTIITSNNNNVNVEVYTLYNNIKTTIINYDSEIYDVNNHVITLGNYISESYFKSFAKDNTIYFKITNKIDNTYHINRWLTSFNVSNIITPNKIQNFTITNYDNKLSTNDSIIIEIYRKNVEFGDINWEFTSSYIGETWFESGLTSLGKQWILTGRTDSVGFHSGVKTWELTEIEPILRYSTTILYIIGNIITVDGRIDLDLFNNISSYDNSYFKIISNNHSDKVFSNIANKLKYYKYYDYFKYDVTTSSLKITPIKNANNIYFNYDKLNCYLSTGNFVGNIGSIFFESGYTTSGYTVDHNTIQYNFSTNNIYNKYTLDTFLNQFTIVNNNIYMSGNTTITNINSIYGDYYITTTIDSTINFKPYTYVKCVTDTNRFYNILITNISGNTITFVKPHNYLSDELILSISNITTINEISDLLDKVYENYNQGDYRKLKYDDIQKIYNTYANILNKSDYNQWIRIAVTGMLFQNEKNIMVLKIFDPTDFTDKRLTYIPSEIMRIGKDKKSSIPINVNDYSIGVSCDVINSNTGLDIKNNLEFGPIYVFNSNLDNIQLVINANL